MSKTLRTSEDYTIKAGAGSSGSNRITLDASQVRIPGNLDVEGTQTIINSTTLSIEDNIMLVSRNNSTPSDVDAGIMVFRGASNNAALYWNEGVDKFKAVTTSSDGTGNEITDTALANIQAAGPTAGDDVATKTYVDTQVVSGAAGFSFNVTADDSTVVPIGSANTLAFIGGANINTQSAEPDTITISLPQDLTNMETISSASSNGSITLTANGTGSIVINEILTFDSNQGSDPTAAAVTKLYAKTPAGGGTGVFFVNSSVDSGTADEVISKKKATALAIALG